MTNTLKWFWSVALRYKNIIGVEKVQRVFTTIPRKNAEQITRALNQGAEEVSDRAQAIVPRDTHELSKDIRVENSGIEVRSDGRSAVTRIIAGTTPGNAQAAFRSEFGRRPSSGHPGHRAQPFLFPAYWSLRKKIRARIARAIRKAVKDSVSG